jgi:hypothetical protein
MGVNGHMPLYLAPIKVRKRVQGQRVTFDCDKSDFLVRMTFSPVPFGIVPKKYVINDILFDMSVVRAYIFNRPFALNQNYVLNHFF